MSSATSLNTYTHSILPESRLESILVQWRRDPGVHQAAVKKWNLDRDFQLNTRVADAYWEYDWPNILGLTKFEMEGKNLSFYVDVADESPSCL